MANVIRIKKGLDIRLAGEAPKVDLTATMGDTFAVTPDAFHGLQPRLMVKAGDRVMAGSPVIHDKVNPDVLLTAPVSGEVTNVVRGAKRRILAVEIKADQNIDYKEFDVSGVTSMGREEILALLLKSGFFALFRQRPYDIVPNPNVTPRNISVTGYLSAPLMPKAGDLVESDKQHLQKAVDALRKLTDGRVVMGFKKGEAINLDGADIYEIEGNHPAGNAGVLANHTYPVNKGETVWTLALPELALIGRFLATGKVDMRRKIVLAGSRLSTPGYVNVISGADIASIINDKLDSKPEHRRVIDGDVLTGALVMDEHKYLSPLSNIITVIPEGDDKVELFGWASLGLNKFSMSHSFPSFMTGSRKYDLDARLNGGKRAIIQSGEYEKVFPMDIYPEQLIKAIIAFDIDRMEELGIYEVAPEDFAVCEFIDTSKLELQYIVRKGLDLLYKEMN